MPSASPLPSRLFLIVCFVGLTGCLSFLHPGSVDRSIDARYDQVFRATLEVLESEGFPLERVDRADGRIETGRRPAPMRTSGRRVETVDAYIEEDGGTVTLRLLLAFTDQVSEAPPRIRDRNDDGRADDVAAEAVSRSVSASAVYDDYLDAIERRARELAGTDGP
jgi:hypothetical protein